jgi:hypothetical protein
VLDLAAQLDGAGAGGCVPDVIQPLAVAILGSAGEGGVGGVLSSADKGKAVLDSLVRSFADVLSVLNLPRSN